MAGRRNVGIPELNTIIQITGLSYEVLISPVTPASTLPPSGAETSATLPEEGANAVQVPPHLLQLVGLIMNVHPEDVADVQRILVQVVAVCSARHQERKEERAAPAAAAAEAG